MQRQQFFQAINDNDSEQVQQLLDHGVSVDCVDYEGKTALHIVVQQNNIELVAFLLKRGASIDVQDEDGQTALIIAAKNKNFDCMKILLEFGAQTESKINIAVKERVN